MSLPVGVAQKVSTLLSELAGTEVRIAHSEPVAEGWSAQFGAWPWVTRCLMEGGVLPGSVIVKARRPESHPRSMLEWHHNERAALEFLTSLGGSVAPRLLAADDEAGILVMEDLGGGAALEDLLLGRDALGATRGLAAYARSLGRMHATSVGHAEDYYQLRTRLGPDDPLFDRVSILGNGIAHSWSRLRQIVVERPYLPSPEGVGPDVDELLQVLSEPGPYLALSNGDTCPANCRVSSGGVRFLDFEHAAFRHALLDAAALRFPFPACPSWSRLPEEVGRRGEEAYRQEMARSSPEVLDDASYGHGLATACAAWTLVRAVRLPKLENADVPHPLGFSRRGQLLDTIGVTVSCARESRSLPSLTSWLAELSRALRARWPTIKSAESLYPAFQSRNLPEA